MLVGQLEIQMAADLAQLRTGMAEGVNVVGEAMSSIKEQVESAKQALEALGAAFVIDQIGESIKSTIEYADELDHLSERLGVSVQDLVGFKLSAQETGATLEDVAQGVKKLSTFMEQHNDLMQQAGITATDASGALIQLSDIFAAMPDGVQKTALAVQLFGRNGIDMIPMLNQGSAALLDQKAKSEDLAKAYEDLAPNAKALNEQIQYLKMYSDAAGASIASQMLPQLVQIAQAMALAAQDGGLVKAALVGIGGVANEFWAPWKAIFLELDAGLVKFDIFVHTLKNEADSVAADYARLNAIYAQQASLASTSSSTGQTSSAPKSPLTQAQAEAAAQHLTIIKQTKDAYDALAKSIQDKIAIDQAELDTDTKLSPAQQTVIKVLTDMNDGTVKLTASEKVKIQALLDEYTQVDALNQAHQQALQDAAALANAGDAEVTRLQNLIALQQQHNDEIGKTKAQIDAVKAATDAAATAELQADAQAVQNAIQEGDYQGERLANMQAVLDYLNKEIALRQQLSGLMAQAAVLDANAAATKQLQADFKSFTDTAESDLENAILNGGSAGGQSLVKKLEKDFEEMVLKVVVQATVNGTIGSALGGSGSSATGAAGSGGTSLFGSLNSLSSLSGLNNTYASGYNAFATSSIGQTLGLSSDASSISGLSGDIAQTSLGSTVGSALPYAGALIEAAQGNYTGAAFTAAGAAIGSVVPVIGTAVGAVIGTVLGDLVGGSSGPDPHNDPDASGFNIGLTHSGVVGAGGKGPSSFVQGQTSGSGRWTDFAPLSTDQINTINQGAQAVYTAGEQLAAILGVNKDVVDAQVAQVAALNNSKGAADQVADAYNALANNIATALLPNISQFTQGTESASQTLSRVVSDIQTLDGATQRLGMSLSLTGSATDRATAVENIIAAGGGSQAFGSNLNTFYTTFYSQTEQLANAQADLNTQFKSLGLQMPTTNDAFRQLVTGIDLSTTAGQALFGQLIAIAPAFAQFTSATQAAGQAAADAAAQLQGQKDQLTEQLLTAQGNTDAATALQRQDILAGLDPSLQDLQKQVWAAQDAAAAAATAAQAQATATQAAASAAQQAAAAAQQLTSAWQSVTDSIFAEIQKIEGALGTSTGSGSLAQTASDFAIATAQARSGNQNAASSLPGLADAYRAAALADSPTMLAYQQIQAQIIASLQTTMNTAGALFGVTVPHFASGTDYVPRDMLAVIHQGEKITPAPFNSRAEGTNAQLSSAITGLAKSVTAMQRQSEINAKNVKDMWWVVNKAFNPDKNSLNTTATA